MALADSGRAIGAVTKLLREHLIRRGFIVSVGRPEAAASNDTGPKLNLFLYEASFDGALRNLALQRDEPPQLWLGLRFLLTAFDSAESSDSADAHELLGQGLAALHALNFLSLDAGVASGVRLALEHNPEPLKVTFEDTPADLLSTLMQAGDESYRFSMAFEVRPVMIAPGDAPSMSLLVGVDTTVAPPAVIGHDGVALAALPSLGPRLTAVTPLSFEPGDVVTVTGEELHLSGLECWLAGVEVSVVGQQPDRLTIRVEGPVVAPATSGPIAAGRSISAGEHPIVVRQRTTSRRFRSSNLLVGRLRPVVGSAGLVAGTLTVNGDLLGTYDDDVLVALRQGGTIARLFEPGPEPPPGPPPPPAPRTVVPGPEQHSLTVTGLTGADGIVPGDYQVVVRVNGQQARISPTVTVTP